jgi:2-hydroxychromene-2-carboxylate isomerase
MNPPRLQFWFEFASTYSYLSVMRIGTLAQAARVGVDWRPFLLGPIFKVQGWSTSPFNVYPAKGRYMFRDIERIAGARKLAFKMPPVFPANGLMAARIATLGLREGWGERFTRAVFAAQYAEGLDISDLQVLTRVLDGLGLQPASTFEGANEPQNKDALRAATEEAVALGIFGAPTFVTTDKELFWGDDRLEQALAWAQTD